MSTPQIHWDWGTAYDFFASIDVLHKPEVFDLRGSWAAGVRSRLPAPERETLQRCTNACQFPIQWIYNLPAPKDGASALKSLAQTPVAKRLQTLALEKPVKGEWPKLLLNIAERGSWTETDLSLAWQLKGHKHKKDTLFKKSKKDIAQVLDCWADPVGFGEAYLAALKAYYEVFFAEEELRIRPALKAAVKQGQGLAQHKSLPELIEDLSAGIHYTDLAECEEITLIPSFWYSPLITWTYTSTTQILMCFGARPKNASLVPGEVVPDALASALKALADPTRLRILYYLSQEALTPTDLANLLRLRPPTVVHHIRNLRMAGLIQATLVGGEDKRYRARRLAITETFQNLESFLDNA